MFFKALSTAFILQYCKYNQSKELTFKWYFLNQIDKKRPPGKFIKLAWFVREIIKSYPTPYPPSVNWDYNVSGLWICEIFTDVEFLSKYAVLCTTRKLPQEGSKASHITLSRPNHIFFIFLYEPPRNSSPCYWCLFVEHCLQGKLILKIIKVVLENIILYFCPKVVSFSKICLSARKY